MSVFARLVINQIQKFQTKMNNQLSRLLASSAIAFLSTVSASTVSSAEVERCACAEGVCSLSSKVCAPGTATADQSIPLFHDSKLNVDVRNFIDSQSIQNVFSRNAWTVNAKINYESGYSNGTSGLGFDASVFAALKIDASDNAGNMIHVTPDGTGYTDHAWAYIGKYTIKARIQDTVVRYGQQQVENPFLESRDNRGLPSTFRGLTVVSKLGADVDLEMGSFYSVIPRGYSENLPLTTSFGGTKFSSISYVGTNWNIDNSNRFSTYLNQASDVWNQGYASFTHTGNISQEMKWVGTVNAYITQNYGRSLEGSIDNKAYSGSLSVTKGGLTGLFGYQHIESDQFFDFVGETTGIALVNAMGLEYAAPHERSIQIRGEVDAGAYGVPGLKFMLWTVVGFGADATKSANENILKNSPLHGLYWKNGSPVQGRHQEVGFYPSYLVQAGSLRGTRIGLIALVHRSSQFYVDNNSHEISFKVNMPFVLR